MYAVIKTGGKQVRVDKGATVLVEKIEGDAGKKVEFDQVLLVADGEEVSLGKPVLAGAKVTGEIIAQEKGPKLVVFKFRRRKNYRRKTGHRQKYTSIKITGISAKE